MKSSLTDACPTQVQRVRLTYLNTTYTRCLISRYGYCSEALLSGDGMDFIVFMFPVICTHTFLLSFISVHFCTVYMLNKSIN